MTDGNQNKISLLISRSLDLAERHWENGGYKLMLEGLKSNEERSDVIKSYAQDEAISKIPGYEIVKANETVVDDFIAIVVDMRNSTQHLMCATGKHRGNISELQRVFYETSALLPALEATINLDKGSVTEYLGDGVLAFFQCDKEKPEQAIYDAHNAAKNCLNITRHLVNDALQERYNLEPMDIGIGLAKSQAIISLAGLQSSPHPKAFGKCVFRATKLSSGTNIIYIDEALEAAWPTQKGGTLKFVKKESLVKGVTAYMIERTCQ
jgi:class 3 adenylate cyclase